MKCPACQHTASKVVDSRSSNDGNSIRRRRECLECGFRYSTYEQIELLNLYVIKKNGERESYQQEKLKRGINRALEKRPVTEKHIKKIITDIEQEIQSTGKTEISVNEIGEIVMKILSEVDEVAYIRFASVYRSFKDIDSFKKELNKLLEK
jgi:transcriptional repressor NrdR